MQDIPMPAWLMVILLLAVLHHFGFVKVVLFVGALVVIQQLAGCGGGELCADAAPCELASAAPPCPSDASNFVGPLPQQCEAEHRTTRTPRKPQRGESA